VESNGLELDKKAEEIARLILGGSSKSKSESKPEIDNPERVALSVVNEDRSLKAVRVPDNPKKLKLKGEWSRQKALRILELRIAGHSFEDIAVQLGYKSGRHAQAAYVRLMDKAEKESTETLRQLQNERLEMAWQGLAPKIVQGRERAVEVGMKVLERQARLQGLDKADQLVEKSTGQPIQINIMAHPGDPKAQAMIIDQKPLELEEKKE
jgi:hypothetical protein